MGDRVESSLNGFAITFLEGRMTPSCTNYTVRQLEPKRGLEGWVHDRPGAPARRRARRASVEEPAGEQPDVTAGEQVIGGWIELQESVDRAS
jgi:hypothetical protein